MFNKGDSIEQFAADIARSIEDSPIPSFVEMEPGDATNYKFAFIRVFDTVIVYYNQQDKVACCSQYVLPTPKVFEVFSNPHTMCLLADLVGRINSELCGGTQEPERHFDWGVARPIIKEEEDETDGGE